MAGTDTGVILIASGQVEPDLARTVQRMGGYRSVEIGLLGANGSRAQADVRLAAARVAASGAHRVLLIPLLTAAVDDRFEAALDEAVMELRAEHPDVEFIPVRSGILPDEHARLLAAALVRAEEGSAEGCTVGLSVLSAGQQAVVQRLCGCNEFISQMAALGFVPGSSVDVVQNYGTGPLIVSVRGGRLALGREEARKVRVRVAGQPAYCRRRFGRPWRRVMRRGRRHE
jgi:ferrous iron transport protein A